MSHRAQQIECFLAGIEVGGVPLTGYLIFPYAAGTTTYRAVYLDAAKTQEAASSTDIYGKKYFTLQTPMKVYGQGVYKFYIVAPGGTSQSSSVLVIEDASYVSLDYNNATDTISVNVTGDITGNVTGNVTGNLTGNVTGNVTGNLTGTATKSDISLKNKIINGCCRVAQNAAVNITTSRLYGAVDMFSCYAGGTVGAGTIAQSLAAPAGRSGAALHLSGVTLTGTGIVYAVHRIESKDAGLLKNVSASFGVRVYHDVGSNQNYTVTVRKANAADDFTATTVIQAGAATAVVTATETWLKLENITMGDCSNGIEIEVKCECGAVTTKNFYFTEWQLEEGATATQFECRPYAEELKNCRHFYKFIKRAVAVAETAVKVNFSLAMEAMRAAPTVSLSGTLTVSDGVTASTQSSSNISASSVTVDGFISTNLNFAGLTAFRPYIVTGSNYFILDARL